VEVKRSRYSKYGGKTPFTRKLLAATLVGLDCRLPVDRFYELEPIYVDDIPPELFSKELPVRWLEQKLRTDSQRINRGFWALNRTLLKRHGLRIISYRKGKDWYRRFVPTVEGMSWFEEYLRRLPPKDAKKVAESIFRTLEGLELDEIRKAELSVEKQKEAADLRAHLAALLRLRNVVIEQIDIARRRIQLKEQNPSSTSDTKMT